MNRPVLSLSLILLLCGISSTQAAEVLTPQHLQRLEELQRRADILAFGGTGSSNYHLAKARTWLDFALSEYFVADTSGIVSAAIEQTEALLDALEQKKTGITMDTPLQMPGSEPVHPDLWDKITALKNHANFSCGQHLIAEAEVHLVRAGHEKSEYGQSHAEPFEHTAASLVDEAQAAIRNCAEARQMAPDTPARVIEKTTQSGEVPFEFGKATLNADAHWRIDKLVDGIRELTALEGIELVGHTDHLRKDGKQELNMLLSMQRAESIRQYLITKGIPADKIHARSAGSSQPLVLCPPLPGKKKQIACLQPNRRVEIVFLLGAK